MREAIAERNNAKIISLAAEMFALIGEVLQVQLPPITNVQIYERDGVQGVCVFANGNKYAWLENRGFIFTRDSYLGLANWAVFYLNKRL
jgi:hypothetical protein